MSPGENLSSATKGPQDMAQAREGHALASQHFQLAGCQASALRPVSMSLQVEVLHGSQHGIAGKGVNHTRGRQAVGNFGSRVATSAMILGHINDAPINCIQDLGG